MSYLRSDLYSLSLYPVSYTHLDVYKRQEVKDINEITAIYRRQWGDHLQMMTEDRLTKAALNYKAIGRRDVNRPRMRWVPEQECII